MPGELGAKKYMATIAQYVNTNAEPGSES